MHQQSAKLYKSIALAETKLAQAEQRIVEAEQHITKQNNLIAWLASAGYDITSAENLLLTLTGSLNALCAHRKLIISDLNNDTK